MTLAAPVAGAVAGAVTVPAVADLEVRGLAKSFGGTTVFREVGFALAPGQAVALVGANGTGKSTLLRICLGLLPPDAGEVRLFGTPVGAGDMRARRAKVGFVAQRHNLSPRLSVLSNVIHGLLGAHSGPRFWWQALAPDWARAKAAGALASVGLADLALRRADRLSGGQSQRVAIARALVAGPRFLVADEPAASLDPAAGEEVMGLFFRLMRETGVTVLFTSHHLDHALAYADRVIGLHEGRLALDARAADLTQADLRGLYG